MACLPCFLSFCPFVFFSCPLVLLSPALLLGFLPCLLSCSLSCLLGFVAWFVGVLGLLFPFPFRMHRQKERAQFLASSLGVLWVALFGCGFVLCELVRTQSVNIVTKFYIKIFAAGAANFFALACVLTCIVVSPFHISCV